MAKLSKKNEELLKAVQKQTAREQDTVSDYVSQNKEEPGVSQDISTVGVGVDLLEIVRMERALERTPRIHERVFTSGEREYANSKAKPAVHYATFFAAREAVLKALGTGFAGMGFQDVEITHDKNGKPLVLLHNAAADLARQQGITEVQISLSHTHQMAVASAVAIKVQSAPRKKETVDPMEELARQFKELRSMLDDLSAGASPARIGEQEDEGAPPAAAQEELVFSETNLSEETASEESSFSQTQGTNEQSTQE